MFYFLIKPFYLLVAGCIHLVSVIVFCSTTSVFFFNYSERTEFTEGLMCKKIYLFQYYSTCCTIVCCIRHVYIKCVTVIFLIVHPVDRRTSNS